MGFETVLLVKDQRLDDHSLTRQLLGACIAWTVEKKLVLHLRAGALDQWGWIPFNLGALPL